MDSDLSLIEISGEDDSLLQPLTAGDGVSSFNNGGRSIDYFLCSPLQLPRSFCKPIEGTSGANKECFNIDSSNKENFNVEKQETLKLSIEPHQMKRKKKGGGYNLRKSLAWDRAFFTEEGVLDAAELSMISGNISNSKGQTLSAIQEDSDSNSSDLLTLEENLFKELPAATTSEKTKKVGSSLLPKKRNNEATTSVANRKVLSTHDDNRSGSKRSACPRPVVSSSYPSLTLKRPASFVTTKASEKVSKVSKLPVQKPSPCAPPSRIGKGSIPSARDSKQSQISRPAVTTHKIFGLKGSSNNTKSVTNISNAGNAGKSLLAKTSLGPAKRNATSSVKCSSTNVPPSTEVNKSLEVIPNPLRPSTGYPSVFNDGGSGKIPMPVSQNQIAKPTGLRMPSPSMGFFGQIKAPTLQSPLKMTSQSGNVPEPNISSLRKLGITTPVSAPKPPLPPRSLPKVMMDCKKTKDIKASETSSGGSNFPTLNLVSSHETVEITNVLKVENKLESGEISYEAIKNRNRLRGTFGVVDHQGLATLHANDKCLLQMQFDTNVIGTNVVDGNIKGATEPENMPRSPNLKLEEDEPYSSLKDHSVSSQPTGPTFSDSQMLQENVTDASPHLQSTEQEKEDIITPFKATQKSNMEELVERQSDADIKVKILDSNSSYPFESQQKMVASDVTEKTEQLEISESLPEHFPLFDEPEGGETFQSELKSSGDPCLSPVNLLDGGSELVEFQSQDNIRSVSIDSKPLSKYHSLENQFLCDIVIHGKTTLVELGNMKEHHVADVNVTCQNSGQDATSNILSAPSLRVLLEGDASVDHKFERNDAEDKKLNSSVNSPCHNSDLPEDDCCPDHNDNSIGQICVLGGEDDVNKAQEDQGKHIMLIFGETAGTSCELKQCPEANSLFFHDSVSLEEPHGFKNGNNSSVYPEVSCHDGSGLENPGLSLPQKMDDVFKGVEVVNHVIVEQDENYEFLYPDIRTGEDSTSRIPGVGLGPMSQESSSVQVFSEKSDTIFEWHDNFETEKSDHEEQSHMIKEQYVNPEILPASFLGVGMNDVAHENTAEVPEEENDVESVLGQRDDCRLEPKITFSPVKTTQDHEVLGENKEPESLKVEVAETSNFEIQSSVVCQKQETESNLRKTDASKPDLVAEQSEQKKAGVDKMQDTLVIKPPINAVPFSDEWLEALEAAGEEILTMKSGAVQNSPQDRSQPEPSPWSPVKRKHNQTLGPFDCTKHTNH